MSRILTSIAALLLSATVAASDSLADRTARIDNLKCTVLLVFWDNPDIIEDDIMLEINSLYVGFVRGASANIADFRSAYTEICNDQQKSGLYLIMRKTLDKLDG